MDKTKEVSVGNVKIGFKNPLVLISGPCVIESEESAINLAEKIKNICRKINMPFIFKASFDKANKTIKGAYRGPGLKKGLAILQKVKEEVKIPVTSDVHWISDVEKAAKVLDLIQIPASLCKQIDLVIAAAKTEKPINIKKGQFVSPWNMRNIIKKIEEETTNRSILLTERGTLFGYDTMINDFRCIQIMKSFGYPVIYDASHSAVMPSFLGDKIGKCREFIPTLAKAAIAAGASSIFIESHEEPDKALSDSEIAISLNKLEEILPILKEINLIVKNDS